jgi:hypothetical protein
MGTGKSTTPSSDSCGTHDKALPTLDLNLPDEDRFRSWPSRISMAEFVRRNQVLRQWFPNGLKTPEERWRAKTDVEFHL